MRRNGSLTWFMTALASIAVALGLLSLPADFSQPIRLSLRDLSRPGQALTRICVGWGRTVSTSLADWQARRSELALLKSQVQSLQVRDQELQTLLTDLRQRTQQTDAQTAATSTISSDPLFVVEFVQARVLGQETVSLAAGRKLLDVGKSRGVGDDLLVVEPHQATLDVGTDYGMTIHQPVFSGEIVIGRTSQCGRYSCSIQPVTDAKFQGPAQVLRKTGTGLQGGPEGVLEGTGKDFCRLTGVWSGEAVSVCDEVYTPAAYPLLPHPMFYGRVIRAKSSPGMQHWEIDVEPAAKALRPTFVRVLRPKENVARVSAN